MPPQYGRGAGGESASRPLWGESPLGDIEPMSRDVSDEERLVRDHLGLVDHAVVQLAARLPRHVPRDELQSAAMAGLAQAARAFDSSRDIRFDHYASARIRGALLDEL